MLFSSCRGSVVSQTGSNITVNDFEKKNQLCIHDDKDFFDVTLACDDDQIQAHKVIPSACNPLFQNVLRHNPHQHPLLEAVKYTDLQSVLNFMYHVEVSVAQEELNSYLAVAEDLITKGLARQNQEVVPACQDRAPSSTHPCM